MRFSGVFRILCAVLLWCGTAAGAEQGRAPADEAGLKFWLENMVAHHRFTVEEVRAATGLGEVAIQEALRRHGIKPGEFAPTEGGKVRVLPYPGGRHPRIGFLDGAVDPQRETKVSVFTPWDPASYVVVDVPEAIWSNLGLTYLAHTHVPTIWSKQGVQMERLEWERPAGGALRLERRLPNGIVFGASVQPEIAGVRMRLWLRNGTDEKLSDLRVQNCVMLKGALGFTAQSNDNKVMEKPYVAARSAEGGRWIITAWEPCDRPWANAPVPCLHSDPKFADCEPGATVELKGWLSFYKGLDVRAEFRRLDRLGWK